MASLSSPQIRGAGITALILVAWVVLAVRSPDLTYHFAPPLAALAWPALLRTAEPAPIRNAVRAGVSSFLLTTAAAIGLHLSGHLDGPTFWNDGPAVVEAVLFAAIGAAIGVRVASRTRPGLLGRVVAE